MLWRWIEGKDIYIDELIGAGIISRSKTGKLLMAKEYKRIVAEISHHGEINGEINNLSDSLKEVYRIVKDNPGIKIKQVANARSRKESTLGKQLADLVRKDFIVYRGAKKTGGYYVK